MSWQPKILNRNQQKIEDAKTALAARKVREEQINMPELMDRGNIVTINNNKFICPTCKEGWTFARMKTIECCGVTYVRN